MMLLIQCVTAYTAVLQLMDAECEYKTAHALLMLKRALQPHVDFFSAKEMELVDAYAVKNEKGKVAMTEGKFQLADAYAASNFKAAKDELCGLEIELDWKIRKVAPPKQIRPVHLEALEGLLEFEGGDA